MMKRLLIFLCFIVLYVNSYAQTFSNDRAKFAREFQSAVQSSLDAEHTKKLKNILLPILQSPTEISDRHFSEMVTASNTMIEKKLLVYPDVYNYVYSICALVMNKQSESTFDAFDQTIDKLLSSKNPKRIADYVDATSTFFYERKLIGKSNFEWYYYGGTFAFKYSDKPFIEFKGGNLICRAIDPSSNSTKAIDSVVVYNTDGLYDPTLQQWDGNSGRINWVKVGLPEAETYAELTRYRVSFKSSDLRADSVMLRTPFFKELIPGRIADKAMKITRKEDKRYPQFTSYNTNHMIKELKPNVDYKGGFALQGSQFYGAGNSRGMAQIILKKNGKPFVTSSSNEIFITDERIYSSNSIIAIKLQSGDSITHPGVSFDYFFKEGTINFVRTTSGSGQAPFRDTYLNLEYYVPKLQLNEKENKLYLTFDKGMSQEQRIAKLESFDYFDIRVYEQMNGVASQNPLVALDKFTYDNDEYYINEGKCASALGGTISQMKPLMLELANQGFITYDTESKMILITPKVSNFVKARYSKKDYDNISFLTALNPKEFRAYTAEQIKENPALQQLIEESKSINARRRAQEHFGVFDLNTLKMNLVEVEQVSLSDRQGVVVFPNDGKLQIGRNRSFEFNGWINAGKVEIEALSANYNYDDNIIHLLQTRKSYIRAQPRKPEHGKYGIPTTSSFADIIGQIKVDLPTNRSGYKQTKETSIFPILEVTNSTKVFYNYSDLYRGAYDSTRFYYSLGPFVIDSLDNFNDVAFRMKGTLVSAGIFPNINEELRIMPDYSFGFSTSAPETGLNFYGTGAKYANKIVLSNNGLQGAGTIKFQHATSVSKELFTFLPDSTLGYVTFVNEPVSKGIEFPKVRSDNAYMVYLPKNDLMRVYSTPRNDLDYFDDEAKLRGMTVIRANGMTGRGLMTFNTATIVSDKFVYKYKDILADTSSFNLSNSYKEDGESELAFETRNVKSNVSFTDRKGVFVSNAGTSEVKFPINQYICRMDQFTWFMDKEEIELEKEVDKDMAVDTGVDLVGPNFFSIHPKQDSLRFRAPMALFNMKQKTIFCTNVEYLDIADARIYPDSSKVNIRKKAKLDQFTNATIIANYITKYHKFERATVDVTARKAYTASGEYPYYSKDSIPTFILMQNIKPDSAFVTRGEGVVEKDRSFKLNEHFDYYGKLKVVASSPEIYFEGATRINHNCTDYERNWLAFSSFVDPKNIQIPVKSVMKNLEGEAISAGIVWRDSPVVDSIALYPTFLSKLVNANDPVVASAHGYLTYNKYSNEFQIGTKEKLVNRNAAGNFLAMNVNTCNLLAEGVINLGMDHGDLNVETIGTANYDKANNETRFNLTARFNMPLDKGQMKDVAERINEANLKPMEFNLMNTLKMAVTNWSGPDAADKLVEDYSIKNEVKRVPVGNDAAIVLSGIHLKFYNSQANNYKGLISTVESAILVSMFDKPVMKYVKFGAFFQQKYSGAGGDWMGMLIDIPGGSEYFFNYSMNKKDGILDIVTSDDAFKSAISSQKEDKRKKKNFLYQLGQGGQKQIFYNLF